MNLELYNKVKKVPAEAQKTIKGGRLNGFTDINPMWRIRTLTEQFGICGIGWKYTIDDRWIDVGKEDEIVASVAISLYIKDGDKWSDAIPGVGGSSFVTKERNGAHVSDECYKMALTDALSVACKALGIGADIYWGNGSKYGEPPKEPPMCKNCGVLFQAGEHNGKKYTAEQAMSQAIKARGEALCKACYDARRS